VISIAGTGATANDYAVLGGYQFRKGHFDVAEAEFLKGLEKDAASAESRIGLLGIRIRQGRMVEAADLVEKLGQIPGRLNAAFMKAVEDGLDGFNRNRVVFADTADNHFAYAKVLVRAGRMKETLAATEHTTRLAPDNHAAWNLVASIYRQMGRFDKSRDAYNKSLAILPDQPRTREALDSLAKDEEALKQAQAQEAAATAKAAQPATPPEAAQPPSAPAEGQQPEPGDVGPIPMPSLQ
jgi:tetratricopeptide (TPR) repeat protein